MDLNKFQKYNSTQTKALPNNNSSDSFFTNNNLQNDSKGTRPWILHEDIFEIDHIFEQILNPLPKQKLLECRLVSHRWNSMVTSTMLKDPKQKQVIVEVCGTKFRTLVFLLQNRKSRENLNLLAPFPVSNFDFQIPSGNNKMKPTISFENFINDEDTEVFFTLHGMHIKKLSLCLKNGWETKVKDLPTEGFLMKSIIKLLTCHAPTMTHFRLDVQCRNKLNLDKKLRPDLRHEKFQKEIQMEQTGKQMCHTESRLKVLHIPTGLSGSVFESILKISSELLRIDTNAGDSYCSLHPLKKLHLLQRLCTCYPVSTSQADVLQTVSHLCGDGLNRMKLKELQFRAPHYLPGFEEIITSILGSVNRILKASSNSLQILCWDRADFHPGLIWPHSLPNVSLICLRASRDREVGAPYGRTKLFPSGFNWQKKFPNVKSFHFYISETHLKAIQFVNSFNMMPLQSVRDVLVRTNACVPLGDVELISTFFPAAKVTIDSNYHTFSYYIPHNKLI